MIDPIEPNNSLPPSLRRYPLPPVVKDSLTTAPVPMTDEERAAIIADAATQRRQSRWIETTRGILVVGPLVVIIYDILAAVFGGNEATISVQAYRASWWYHGLIVAYFGLSMHLFFPVTKPQISLKYAAIAAVVGCVLGLCFFRQHPN